MLITAFVQIRPEGYREPCNEVGSLNPAKRLAGFEPGTFRFWFWVVVQKIYSKLHLVLCNNTHRDVKDLVNHMIVKNAKPWISWERNIIFLRNKKILNLCLRWHIWRSYRFVAEVTFKSCLVILQHYAWKD